MPASRTQAFPAALLLVPVPVPVPAAGPSDPGAVVPLSAPEVPPAGVFSPPEVSPAAALSASELAATFVPLDAAEPSPLEPLRESVA
jgi:hypothetical protein